VELACSANPSPGDGTATFLGTNEPL